MQVRKVANRREFIRLSALSAGAAALAACTPSAPATPESKPTEAPKPAGAAPTPTTASAAQPTAASKPTEAAKPSGDAKPSADATGKLEIFSWWTSGGEVEALNALYEIYKKKYPKVEIINAALAGGAGAGGQMKAVLKTRMLGGDPPDSFQVHLGHELIDTHVVADRMEPLDFLYKDEGWDTIFPKQLIEIASWQGKPYSVPVNIHRSNVLWYSKTALQSVGAEPPSTWDEFFAVADKLKAKNIPALAIAESSPGFSAHVFESILLATHGPEAYRGLFDGTTKWDNPNVTKALEILKKAIDYANPDYLNVSWGDVNDLLIAGKVAMMVMGDWTPGVLWSKGFKDFGWAPAPGNKGVFMLLSDSFGLPKGVKNRENVINWLKVCGSKEGQDAFNPPKGSIPARTDADISKYTEYHKSAMADFAKDQLVPSIAHGAAAKESFMTDYVNIINVLITKKDVEDVQKKLVEAAKDADFKK